MSEHKEFMPEGKRKYKIVVSGCDDETQFEVYLNDKEHELIKGICDKCTATSTYGCMPTMEIYLSTESPETLTQ